MPSSSDWYVAPFVDVTEVPFPHQPFSVNRRQAIQADVLAPT